ncbi:MAG: glycosyltransferase, partial [Deltaproteobacteria bacterium]
MRVCLFGTYNRGHSVNRIVAAALSRAGFDLIELHEPIWESTRDKDAAYFGPLGLLRLAGRYLVAAVRLARRWHASGGAPLVVIGFNGQLDIVLLRLLALRRGPRVVFAPLVSLTETLVDDRQVYRRGSLGARLLGALDRLTCRLADVVVVDSEAHRRYFVDRLGVPPRRLTVCHLGVDDAVFRIADAEAAGRDTEGSFEPAPASEDSDPPGTANGREKAATTSGTAARSADGDIEVLYFGQYLPLHGLDVVVEAVSRLSVRDHLRFVFIGTGPERERIEPQLRATRARVEFINWVPYDELPGRVAQADIVLGVFGSSAKAAMVVPNKLYQAAAMGRAIVTADTPAVREVFSDGEDIVLCRADGRALADAIERLAADAEARTRIGGRARRLVAEHFSGESLARRWRALVEGIVPELTAPLEEGVGISILSFNDADSTLRCLEHLSRADLGDARVLVVDNGSSAEQRARLEQGMAGRFAARAEWLDRNLGFAGGHNLAMKRLFEEGCRYVLLLNDDTIVTPDALRAMV